MLKIASFFGVALTLLLVGTACRAQNFWEPVSIPESPWFSNDVAVAPNDHVFALSGYYPNDLFVSTDDGISWNVANNKLDVRFPGIVIDHEGRIFGITDTSVICSFDEGKTWSDLRDGSFGALTIGFDDELYMVSATRTQEDSLLISNDHGVTWGANAIDTSLQGIGVIAVNLAGDIFATGSSGVFRSTDRGQSWIEKDAGIDYPYGIEQLLCDKHGEVFAGSLYGGTFAGLYFSTDNGESWTNAPWLAGTYDQVSFIALDSAGRIYAGSGAVWRSTDHGNTWIGVADPPEPSTMAISKSGHIFTGEGNWIMSRSTNEGNSWNYVSWWATSPSPVATGPNGEVLLGTQPDGMVISTDNGNTWTHTPIVYADGITMNSGGIAVGLGGKIFAVGGELFESSDTGKSWKLIYSDLPAASNFYAFINRGVLYAAAGTAVVLSLDSGGEWEEADSCGINSIAGLAADSEGNIYVGGVYYTPGYNYFGGWYSGQHSVNIFKSSDSGKTWLQVAANLTNDTTGEISSFGLTIDDSTRTIFAATNEGIYRSVKGGDWVRMDSLQGQVNGIVVASAGHIFAYNSTGIFYSTNDGDTWSSVNSGLKGLPSWSMSMAVNASGRLFVATDSGLFRSVQPLSSVKQGYPAPSLILNQNSPNPFASSTDISFTLAEPSFVTLALFDCAGREISTLASEYMNSGSHSVPFSRSGLPAGVYFYRLTANGASETRALVIE